MILFGLVIMTRRHAHEIAVRQQELFQDIVDERGRTAVMKRKHDRVQEVAVGMQKEIERLKEKRE